MLSLEKNPIAIQNLKDSVQAGAKMFVPYTYGYKNSLTGGTQTVTVRMSRAHGITLKKIIHSVFNSTESAGTNYDNSNIYGAAPVANAPANATIDSSTKVTQYYTNLDNQRQQEITLRCDRPHAEDYLYMTDMLRGSAVMNREVYGYNWFHCDAYDESKAPVENSAISDDNLISGLSLSEERKWDFVGDIMAQQQAGGSNTFNHYTWLVCQRELVITPTQIVMQ